jgi:hypothetical protein
MVRFGQSVLAGLCAAMLLSSACQRDEGTRPEGSAGPAPGVASQAPADLSQGLLLALAQFEVSPQGKVLPKPGPARLEILTRRGGEWRVQVLEDPASNVFHKAMAYHPGGGPPGILTLAGSRAALKLWRPSPQGFSAELLWEKDFGGKFSRMRDAEAADLFGAGRRTLAVATHDQGVVATLRPKADGSWEVREIDHEQDTFVHEIEIGDLDSATCRSATRAEGWWRIWAPVTPRRSWWGTSTATAAMNSTSPWKARRRAAERAHGW